MPQVARNTLSESAAPSVRSPFRKLALAPQDPPSDAFVVQLKDAPSKDQGRVGISLTDGTTTREVLCAPAACAAGSAFFARMFDKTWNSEHKQESTCRQVPDLDLGESVLRYLGGETLTLDDDNLVAVANMADYWDISALQDDCRSYLAQHLTEDNLCRLFSTSCEVGDATAPLTRHIWDVATALDIQTDETPSSPAAALALASYASAPNELLTIARFKRLTDNPPAYDVHVRWFEPNVLPNISQGKSATFDIDGIQLHVKRSIGRTDDVPTRAYFSLRANIPATFPAQGGKYDEGALSAVHRLSLDYSLIAKKPVKEASSQSLCSSSSSCYDVYDAKEEAPAQAQSQAQGYSRWGDAAQTQAPAPPRRPVYAISDDEGGNYAALSTPSYNYRQQIDEGERHVSASVEHAAGTPGFLSMQLWTGSLNLLDLSNDKGLFRADGSQWFSFDGVLKAVPLEGMITSSFL